MAPAATLISQGTAHAAACGAVVGCDQNGDDGLFTTSDFNAPQTNQAFDGDVISLFADNENRSAHDVDLDASDFDLCEGNGANPLNVC